MVKLTARQRKTLSKNIRLHKERLFPEKGSGNQLAAAMNVSPQVVSFWINNRRCPSDTELARLSVVFRISIFDMCGIHKPKLKKGKYPAMDAIELLMTMHNFILNKSKTSTRARIKITRVKEVIFKELDDIL